jgi:hypothetical protein
LWITVNGDAAVPNDEATGLDHVLTNQPAVGEAGVDGGVRLKHRSPDQKSP